MTTLESYARIQARDGSGKLVLPDGAVVKGYELRHFCAGGMSAIYLGVKNGQQFILKEVPSSSLKEVGCPPLVPFWWPEKSFDSSGSLCQLA